MHTAIENLTLEITKAYDTGYIRLWYTTYYARVSDTTHNRTRRRLTIVFGPTIFVDQLNKVCNYILRKYSAGVIGVSIIPRENEHRMHIDLLD